MKPVEQTKEEAWAIGTLIRLAKRWPKSLWLMSRAGSLCVMRADDDGTMPDGEVVDLNERVVAVVNIPNDGGDW